MQSVEQSTQATFQVLDQIVQAFGGFAQMLDSTFHATYSSFMAMVGVIDQFGVLREYLGRVLSVFALYRFVRNLLYRLTGRTPPAATEQLNSAAYAEFTAQPTYSRKPLFIFLAVVLGIPYLLSVVIRRARARTLEAPLAADGSVPPLGPDGQPLVLDPVTGALSTATDGRTVELARAIADFQGENGRPFARNALGDRATQRLITARSPALDVPRGLHSDGAYVPDGRRTHRALADEPAGRVERVVEGLPGAPTTAGAGPAAPTARGVPTRRHVSGQPCRARAGRAGRTARAARARSRQYNYRHAGKDAGADPRTCGSYRRD